MTLLLACSKVVGSLHTSSAGLRKVYPFHMGYIIFLILF